MNKPTGTRPTETTFTGGELAEALCRYTDPNCEDYDAAFDRQIRASAPGWFELTPGSDWEQRALLRFVREGGEQPAASLTETRNIDGHAYVTLANVRGVLVVYEVRHGSDGNLGLHLLPEIPAWATDV